MVTLAIFALLSAAMFYLGSRALITRAIWSRYSPGFARFMDCSACTGFWWGLVTSLALGDFFEPIFVRGQLRGFKPEASICVEAVLVGLCMLVLTPIVAGLMQRGLEAVGSAIEEE